MLVVRSRGGKFAVMETKNNTVMSKVAEFDDEADAIAFVKDDSPDQLEGPKKKRKSKR